MNETMEGKSTTALYVLIVKLRAALREQVIEVRTAADPPNYRYMGCRLCGGAWEIETEEAESHAPECLARLWRY